MNFAGKSASVDLSGFKGHGDSSADAVTIPDAHLLFSGDYQRSGADLIVSDQLHRVVVADYFHGEKRPSLVSPEGARLDFAVVDALVGHVQYAQAAGGAAAAKVIGHVVKMTGSASIVRNGVTITLNNGDVVYQNDVVQTGSGSTLGLVMIDGTTFNMSANARLMMNDLTYDAASTSNSSLFTLVQGAATFVAGQVAKTGDMKVSTPVATMGIRGTAVILDISAVDGTVSLSVVNQRDGQLHAVEVFNARGDRIGTVTSNGSMLTLTPTASFEVIAQESNKSVAQVLAEFNAFQQLLSTYDIGKQLRPDTPAPTDGRRGDNDQQPLTKFAGSTISPIDSSVTKYNEPVGGTRDAKADAADDFAALKPTGDGTGTTTKVVVNVGDAPGQVVEVAATSIPFVVTPSPVSRISSGAGDHFGPVMSADGQFVTYDPDGAIYLFDRQTGTTRTIAAPADGFTYGSPTISADGRFIVYQGSDGTQSFIFIYNNDASDAGHYGQITRLGPGGQPAVSGDGSKIVIEQGGSIALYDQQGHQLADITAAALGMTGGLWKPAISADGHIIAFWSSDQPEPGGSGKLFTYDLSTATFRSIASTNTDVGTSAASFSADGHFIVYQSDAPGGHSEIYLVDLRSGQTVFHTANTEASYNPVISPDGHFIIFASDARLTAEDGNNFTDIYVVDVSDPAHPLYKLVSALDDGTQGDAASDLGATISVGGQFIAFGSRASNFSTGDNNGAGDIFVVDPNSGHSAIVLEGRNSPAVLTAKGVVKLTGEHVGVTLGVSDSRIAASFDANGDIQWTFNEARSDFGSLQPGEIAVRNFVITLRTDRSTTEIPVKVTVYDVDQTPVPAADAAPVASPVTLAAGTEDTGYTITSTALLAGVSDIDGPSLSITGLSVASGGGTIIDNHNGTFGYTPAANYNGPVVFNYKVSDGTLSASSTARLNIAAVNDAPTVTPLSGSTNEDGAVQTINLLSGATDADHDTLSVINFVGTAHDQNNHPVDVSAAVSDGAIVVGATTVTVDPHYFDYLGAGQSVTLVADYDVSDGKASTHNSATLIISGVNDAPTSSPLNATASEDDGVQVLDLLAGAHDVDISDTLNAINFVGTAKDQNHQPVDISAAFTAGAITFSNNKLTVDPHYFDYLGSGQSVTLVADYDITDGKASTHNTALLTVTGVNDAPTTQSPLVPDPGPVKAPAGTPDGHGGYVPLVLSNNFGFRDADLSDTHILSATFDAASSNLGTLAAPIGTFAQQLLQDSSGGNDGIVNWSFTLSSDELRDLNSHAAPGSVVREVYDVTASDGHGGTAVRQVSIEIDGPAGSPNHAPVFTGDPAGAAFVANGAPVAVAVNVAASDVDSDSYNGGLFTATVTAGGNQGDTLSIVGNQYISVVGNTVYWDRDGAGGGAPVVLGTLTGHFNTLTVTLNNNAGDAAVEALTKAVQFSNSLQNPATGTRTVTFTLNDGGGTVGGGQDSAFFQTTVDVTSASNHAPVLTPVGPSLTSISEDDRTSSGQTVASIVGSSISDPDSAALHGIAITAASSGNGNWQFSTDGGASWAAFASYSTSTALLLDAADKVRFVPDRNNGGNDTFSYVAWDQTSGSHGTTANATTVGGATAFSIASDTAHLTVTAVNDAPSITAETLASITEDDGNPAGNTVGGIFGASFHDVDASSSLKAIAVIADDSTPDQGVWQYKSAGGSWEAIGTVNQKHALIFAVDTELRFLAASDFNGTPGSLQVVGVDDSYDDEFTTGAAQQGGRYTEDVSVSGGSTPFSDHAVTLGISVSAVNDAPVASGSASLAAIDEDNTSPSGDTIANLFGGHFSDAADDQTAAAADGSQADTFAGIAISDYTPDATKGGWQYKASGGNWVVVGAANETAAITLSADVALRFVPAANYNGSATALGVHLIESGGATIVDGATINLATAGTGGSTHYSATTVALGETINSVDDAPVIDGGDTRSVPVDENTTVVTTSMVAHDPDGPSLTWSLLGGTGSPDFAKFSIDPTTGALSFKNAPDFGHPTDSNHNNIYTVQVNVSDGTLSDTETLFVHVTDVNDNAPVITTGAFQFVAENHTFVTQLSAFDVDSVGGPTTFTIADGLDGNLLQIDANGNLRFATAPDFEHPADSNHNNIHSVTVNASDGLNSSSKTLFVQVTNVNEAPTLTPDTAMVSYTENTAPVALMALGSISDPDNPSNFDDGSLSVTLNSAVSGDELVLASIGGVSVSGSSVKVGNTTVGTISGNHSAHLTVDFNANATDSRVETVLHALAFDSTSDNPTNADRTATVTFNDGSNDGSGPALSDSSTVTIHVTPVNDAPHAFDDVVITNNAGNAATYLIPAWALLANDTDPDSVLNISAISAPSGFSTIDLTGNPGNVTIHDNSPVGGSFTYTASDSLLTATARVTVTQDTGTMSGGSGNEIFIGDSSGSTINGNGGDDILIGNAGNDILDGGPGNDIYGFGLADGSDTINHSSGVDSIRIAAGGATLIGLGFAEDTHDNLIIQFNGQQITVTNQFDDSTVGSLQFAGGASYAGYDLGGDLYSLSDDSGTSRNGTSGNDILSGDGNANTISGGDGKDLLFGNAGNDTLNGGSGNDLLVGGAGNDVMSGGPGNDTFVFASGSGRDTISDFTPGQDKISLDYHAFNAGDFGSWLNSHASSMNSGRDVLIDLNVDGHSGGVDTILLQNVGAAANLHAGDFIVH